MDGACINFVMPAAVAASQKKAALAHATHAMRQPALTVGTNSSISFGLMVCIKIDCCVFVLIHELGRHRHAH